MAIKFELVVPIFRIHSLEKTREFYIDFLGCKVDWEYPSEPGAPAYMQVSRDQLVLHLSEHHGDRAPGSIVYVYMTDVAALHRELNDKKYPHNRPHLEQTEWGMKQMTVIDPFDNRILFGEPVEKRTA
jgi:ribosomal-protein-alanine N-acetyltransferase